MPLIFEIDGHILMCVCWGEGYLYLSPSLSVPLPTPSNTKYWLITLQFHLLIYRYTEHSFKHISLSKIWKWSWLDKNNLYMKRINIKFSTWLHIFHFTVSKYTITSYLELKGNVYSNFIYFRDGLIFANSICRLLMKVHVNHTLVAIFIAANICLAFDAIRENKLVAKISESTVLSLR